MPDPHRASAVRSRGQVRRLTPARAAVIARHRRSIGVLGVWIAAILFAAVWVVAMVRLVSGD